MNEIFFAPSRARIENCSRSVIYKGVSENGVIWVSFGMNRLFRVYVLCICMSLSWKVISEMDTLYYRFLINRDKNVYIMLNIKLWKKMISVYKGKLIFL